MSEKALSEMSTEELEKALAKRKAKEETEAKQKREQYLGQRDAMIVNLITEADRLSNEMIDFKFDCFNDVDEFIEKMKTYGDVKERSKGNLTITTEDDQFRIKIKSQVLKRFDERAELAEHKLKSFLESMVKKKDQKAYKVITSLLERNHKGDYDIALIQRLYKMENEFDHELWKEAIKLFKESYSESGTTRYINFFKKVNDRWEPIIMTFASL